MTFLRAVFALLGVAALSIVLIPIQALALALKIKRVSWVLPRVWNRSVLWLIGIRVHEHGALSETRPLLLVSNHVSWLDIMVLAGIKHVSFIAKREVGTWPFIGLLAKLNGTVFVNREKRQSTGDAAKAIADRLAEGRVMVLFGEGTSSNGIHVLPFRTALVGGAVRAMGDDGAKAAVQPVAINYTQLHGVPIGRFHKPRVAWYGDMEMADHLWWILRHGDLDVDVAFGEPIPLADGVDRKRVARRAEEVVRELVGEATAGRLVRGNPLPAVTEKAA